MRRPFPLGLLLTLAASAAGAVETPHPGHADARVRTIDYDPAQVVRISGAYRTAVQILFDENETIQHVAVGDATAWDAVAAKNILFIKPKAAHGITDLIVTTSRPNGDERDYTFELTTEVRRRSGSLYVVRFRYPSDLKASSEWQLSIAERALQTKLMTLNLEHGAIEGARNLAYTIQGSAALQTVRGLGQWPLHRDALPCWAGHSHRL